jgi:hypothetical protein
MLSDMPVFDRGASAGVFAKRPFATSAVIKAMNSQNQKTLLASLLAALTLYFPVAASFSEHPLPPQASSSPPQTASDDSLTSETSQPSLPKKRRQAAKLLCDFFGAGNPNASNDQCEEKYHLITASIPDTYQLNQLIATIPDPKASRLDYLFDRNLDAIQRAVEAAGYVLDRFDLPWDSRKMSPHVHGEQPEQDYRHEPGVILFRKMRSADKRYKLLLLYLVGETPTTGIHKPAFLSALNQIKELSKRPIKRPATSEDLKIQVMGPTFSGSSTSLALSIGNWLKGLACNSTPQIQIISGSAKAIDKENFLKLVDAKCKNVTFNATVPLESDARDAFLEYLQKIGATSPALTTDGLQSNRPEIAIIAETNTAYGRASNPYNKNSASSNQNILFLTFPMGISRLRSEVAKVKPVRTDPLNGIEPQGVTLPMSEVGESGASDVIPQLSPLEIASTEQILKSILTEIDRESIRYIGLTATDVKDRIFLMHELRSHCPNAVIFMFSSDLLYLHPEANLDFQGAMIISPYPFFSLNQLWSYPFKGNQHRVQFSTQSEQGAYNAVLALLGENEKLIEYGCPFDTHWREHFHKPVFWLSIVGRNGLWPVRILGNQKDPCPIPCHQLDADPTLLDSGSEGKPWEELQQEAARSSYLYPVIPNPQTLQKVDQGPIRILIGDRNYSSLSVGAMLLLSLLCLVPSSLLLMQLIGLKIEREKKKAWLNDKSTTLCPNSSEEEKKKPKRAKLAGGWLKIERFVSTQWINHSSLGRVFGLSDQFRHGFDRRVYLFACCVSLLMISALITSICLLPDWIKLEQNIKWEPHWFFQATAYSILLMTLAVLLIVTGWLALSIVGRLRRDRPGLWSTTLGFVELSGGLIFAGLTFGVCVYIFYGASNSVIEGILFYLRATDLRSGVSIMPPSIFIGVAMFLYFFSALLRLDLAERMPCLKDRFGSSRDHEPFLNFSGDSFVGVSSLEDKIKTLMIGRIFSVPGAFLTAILLGLPYFNRFVMNRIPSIEGRPIDWMFIAAFYFIPILLSWAFLRFVWLSLALKRLLRRLANHPLFNAPIAKDDLEFRMLPKVSLMMPTPTNTPLSSSIIQAKEFFILLDQISSQSNPTEHDPALQDEQITKNREGIEQAERKLIKAVEAETNGKWQESLEPMRDAQRAVSDASKFITEWMEPYWIELNDKSSHHSEIIKKACLFTLGHVAALLQHVLAHLQNLAGLVTGGLLLILLATNTYPFHPRQPLLLFSWISILIAVTATLAVFLQLSRDKVFSVFMGTTPGEVNITRDLVFRVLIHGVLPIILLLGFQFPDAVRNLLSLLSILDHAEK